MIRFLEGNGYDASYIEQRRRRTPRRRCCSTTSSSSPAATTSTGPATQRTNVEAARDAGVNLAFFSGNEVFWKTRWRVEHRRRHRHANRTLVSYKDTHFDAADRIPSTWTGTWRDPRFSAPRRRHAPENALTGQLVHRQLGHRRDITVPVAYKHLRLWRNTAVASLGAGQSRTLGAGNQTLGYEWDVDADNGFRPRGQFQLSSTTVSGVESFTDYGSTTKQGTTQTHHLTMYRAPSGARVFGAGTVQWAWGLDDTNAWNATGRRRRDAGSRHAAGDGQPVRRHGRRSRRRCMRGLDGRLARRPTRPRPLDHHRARRRRGVATASTVTISGTATDAGGGVVAGVEVSTDGGTTWHPATGTTSLVLHAGSPTARRRTTIKVRATDDSGNLESSGAERDRQRRLPVLAGRARTRRPRSLDEGDPSAGRGRRQVQGRHRRDGHRRALLQGDGQHRHAHRQPVDDERDAARAGDLQRRERHRLAAADLHDAGRHHARERPTWRRTTRPAGHYSASSRLLTTSPGPVGGDHARQPAAARHHANRGSANGVYSYAAPSTFPTDASTARTTAVDVVFAPKLAARRGEQRHGHARPRLRDGQLHGARHRRPAHALHRHPVHRLGGAAVGHRDRHPAGDVGQGRRPRPGDRRTPSRSRPATAAAPVRSRPRPTRSRRTRRRLRAPRRPSSPARPTSRRRCAGPRRTTAAARSPATPSRRTSTASRRPRPR